MPWKIWDQDVPFAQLASSVGKYLIAEIQIEDRQGNVRQRTQIDATISRINQYEGIVINVPKIGGEVLLSTPQRRNADGIPETQTDTRFHALCEKIHDMAVKYYRRGREQNGHEKAFKLCTLAAKRGHARSQFLLAMFYVKGIGTDSDFTQAITWFKRAAQQDNARAQYNLAHMYITGKGIKRDDNEAFYWYARAAQNGIEEASRILKSRRSANELLHDIMKFQSSDNDIVEHWKFYVPSYSYDADYAGKMIKLSGRMLYNPQTGTFRKFPN